MSQRLAFEIQFHSDFHIGAGHGLGLQVDSALLRDPDGVPVIRGTILNGLLRDSLHDLLSLPLFESYRRCRASGLPETDAEGNPPPAYCGQFEPSDDLCPVCAVFGTPAAPKRWRISSARPNQLPVSLPSGQAWRAGETAAQPATRVRVNPRTRRAEENKLFTREEGDRSLVFHFTAECVESDEWVAREAEWLVAAARWLRRIGASKLRGRGECTVRLVTPDQAPILQRFQQRLNNAGGALETDKPTAPTAYEPLPTPSSDLAYRVQVVLHTDEPLLVASRAEAGNQFATLEALPGASLRGALAWRVARRRGAVLNKPDSPAYGDFVQLFFGDALRFSPLVPLRLDESNKTGYATLIAPRDLRTSELYPGYDGDSQDQGRGVRSQTWQGTPSKEQRGSDKLEAVSAFIPLDSRQSHKGLTIQFKPQQTAEMHIRLLPATGRVQSGDLFGYVALEPGQYFVGEITCANEQVWDWLQRVAGFDEESQVHQLHIGRGSQRGYGLVSLVFQPLTTAVRHGADLAQRVTDPVKVVLTLESDAIVIDPWGRFVRGFDAHWLKTELGLPPAATVKAVEDQAYSAVRNVDAFNAKLGLPRGRDMALAAGSCVLLQFTGIELADLQSLLRRVEADGIGVRRQEGFGRVAFNHSLQTQSSTWASVSVDLGALMTGQSLIEDPEAKLVAFRHAWERELDEALGEQEDGKKPDRDFEDERFEAVARLLHVSKATSPAAVLEALKGLGQPDQLLTEELKGRDKKNFYTEGDGKAGLQLIRDLVAKLDGLTHDYQAVPAVQTWRIGLSMLADRIAGPARRKADERR